MHVRVRSELNLASDSYALVGVDGQKLLAPVVGGMSDSGVYSLALRNPIFFGVSRGGRYDLRLPHARHCLLCFSHETPIAAVPRLTATRFVALSRSMVDRIVLLCGLALFAAIAPTRALAEPAPASSNPALRWDVPATCPSNDLLGRLAGMLRLNREELGSKLLRVEVVARPAANGGWQTRVEIATVAGSGERSFWAEDCGSLADAVTLILALTVDPSAVSPRALSGSPFAGLAAKPGPRTAWSSPQVLLRPLLAADLGLLPDAALAYGLAVGVAWPSLRFEIDGSYQSAQTVSDGLGHSGRVRIPIHSGARACVAPWRWNALEPGACLGAAVAWLRSTGKDLAVPETHDSLAVAATVGVAVGWRLRDWLWLRAETSLGFVVRQPRFQVVRSSQSPADVYSVRRLTARVGGGLEFRL